MMPLHTGDTPATAISIDAEDSWAGIDIENAYLTARFGERGSDWEKVGNCLIHNKVRTLDRIEIATLDGHRYVFFDITSFLPGSSK
jgi:hypothetical protein